MAGEGLLVVISGPSGVGKGTVCRALLETSDKLVMSVSKTTRPPREGEVDGVNYHFVSREEFFESVEAGDFLEYACVYDEYYGTPRAEAEKLRQSGLDVILEIDIQGAKKVREVCPDGVFIFLVPPSVEELRRRIKSRGSETPESLQRRMNAVESELRQAFFYDYLVVNDDVNKARDRLAAIIAAEKQKVARNKELITAMIEEAMA